MTRDRLLRDGKMNLTGMKGMNGIGEDANPLSPLYPFPVAVGSPNHAAVEEFHAELAKIAEMN